MVLQCRARKTLALRWRQERWLQSREDLWHRKRSLFSPACFLGSGPLWDGDYLHFPDPQGSVLFRCVQLVVPCTAAMPVKHPLDVV